MKAVIKGIVVLFVMLVVGLVGGAYLIAPVAVVERAAVVRAEPSAVYAVISDLQHFREWSPMAQADPSAEYRLEGPETGVGQKLAWTSQNPQVGKGSLTIAALEENRSVVFDIDYGGMGKAQSTMVLTPVEGGTSVVWTFRAPAEGVLERWASLAFDRWIGAEYVDGLSRLKLLVEPKDG